nr:hypothetical protein [Pleurocapsa sp. CCALA 161]
MMLKPISLRLEQYTLQRKQEVLMVHLETAAGEPDTVVIFAGFSSSLVMPTAFDPDIPVIAADSTIHSIDRLASPYNPSNPQYLESGLSLPEMIKILETMNL